MIPHSFAMNDDPPPGPGRIGVGEEPSRGAPQGPSGAGSGHLDGCFRFGSLFKAPVGWPPALE